MACQQANHWVSASVTTRLHGADYGEPGARRFGLYEPRHFFVHSGVSCRVISYQREECVYLCTCVCVHVSVSGLSVCVRVCVCLCMHSCVRVCTSECVCARPCTQARVSVRASVSGLCVCPRVPVGVRACARVCHQLWAVLRFSAGRDEIRFHLIKPEAERPTGPSQVLCRCPDAGCAVTRGAALAHTFSRTFPHTLGSSATAWQRPWRAPAARP